MWRRAAAGILSGGGMVTAVSALALVLAVPAGTASATSTTHKTVKVSTAKVTGIGTVLTTASGLTLYRFTEDTPGTSSCTGACAKIWPPLLASKGAHVSAPKGVKGLALMNVGNGHWQVAYHKIPLYRFEGDKKKGQANGQNVGKVWFAAMKSGIPASNAAPLTASTTPTTTAPSTSTSQAPTPATQGSGLNTPAPAVTPTTRAPAPAPAVTPPTSPPTTTPPTSPPTTPTTAAGGGGYGY
jgi:predicted lipoprotein with Yx(FWY)xxD motif